MGRIQAKLYGIKGGSTHIFRLIPTDANGDETQQTAGNIPIWTASPPTHVSLTRTVDGLTCIMKVTSTIPAGETVTLTVTGKNVSGATITDSVPLQQVGTAPNPVTGYIILQVE